MASALASGVYVADDRMPFLKGSLPVATAAQTGPGCVGRTVARCSEAPRSSRRPKFGRRPSAAAGAISSSEAPSSRTMTTRASPAGPATSGTVAGQRTFPGASDPGPRSIRGTAIDTISAEARAAAPGLELWRPAQRWPSASAAMTPAHTVSTTAPQVMRVTASGSMKGARPLRFTQVSRTAIPAAAEQSHTRKRKLIQPGEITSVARTCRRTISA